MNRGMLSLIAATLAFGVAAGTCGWLLAKYLPGVPPQGLYMDAGIIAKMAMMLVQLLFLPILGLGLIGLLGRPGQFHTPLALLAAGSATVGLLGAAYGWMTVQMALSRIGPTSFAITAPSYAEAALVASLGLFGAVVALGLRTMGELRA
jgi:hypothetical protein